MKQKVLIQGDVNLLKPNEILITQSEGYTILRERDLNSKMRTYIVVPLEEFTTNKNKGDEDEDKDK